MVVSWADLPFAFVAFFLADFSAAIRDPNIGPSILDWSRDSFVLLLGGLLLRRKCSRGRARVSAAHFPFSFAAFCQIFSSLPYIFLRKKIRLSIPSTYLRTKEIFRHHGRCFASAMGQEGGTVDPHSNHSHTATTTMTTSCRCA